MAQYNLNSVFHFILLEGQVLNSSENPRMMDKTNTFILEITIMGEVFVYYAGYPKVPFWSSKSSGSIEEGPYAFSMESSGNLVIRNNRFLTIWSTRINEQTYQGPYYMQLMATSQVLIRNNKRQVIWHSNTFDSSRGSLNYKWYGLNYKKDTPYCFTLQEGQQLNAGMVDTMYDKTRRFSCKIQMDGNLVIRHNESQVVWSTGSIAGNDFFYFKVDPKGNGIVFSPHVKKTIWETQTSGIPENFYFELKTNGQLLLRDKYREILWFSVIKQNHLSPDTVN
ncbi:hypothetical protein ACTA71_006315 [Dictyostelium dimigraforme]